MKYLKYFLAFTIFIFLQLFIIFNIDDPSIFKIISICLIGLFCLHLIMRQSIEFRAYFESKWNFLCSKYKVKKNVDIPRDLLFDKLLELMPELKLTKKYANKDEMVIFATSKLSLQSWGENIYIDLREGENGLTEIDFSSITFFQIFSMGKNESNFHKLIGAIDKSLII